NVGKPISGKNSGTANSTSCLRPTSNSHSNHRMTAEVADHRPRNSVKPNSNASRKPNNGAAAGDNENSTLFWPGSYDSFSSRSTRSRRLMQAASTACSSPSTTMPSSRSRSAIASASSGSTNKGSSNIRSSYSTSASVSQRSLGFRSWSVMPQPTSINSPTPAGRM